MADTVNSRMLALSVSHQVGLVRYSNAVSRRVVALLDRNDSEIADLVRSRGAGAAQANGTLARLSVLNKASTALLGEHLGEELERLSGTEVAYHSDAVRRLISGEVGRRSPTAAALRAIVYSQPFQGGLLREWVAGVEQGRLTRLRIAIRNAIALGESTDQLITRVIGTASLGYRNGILDISRRSASTLVRTAVAHVASSAREAYYRENSEIVRGIRWVSVLDSRTSAPCRALDGKIYPLGVGPRPPNHLNCRSTTSVVFKSWQELGLDEADLTFEQQLALNGEPPPRLTYSDWLTLQPAAIQDSILGARKARLFRQGDLTLEKFVDRTGKELTLADLRKLDDDAFFRAGL